MKKIYLLLLLLSLKSAGFCQSKYEFGFSVKSGNFALPSSVRPDGYELLPSQGTYHQNSGQVYILGIYQAFPLGKRFQLSTELLYRAAFYGSEELNYLNFFNGNVMQTSISQTKINVQQSSLSLPVLLQYSFKKKPKLSIFSGFGLSHGFRSNTVSNTSFQGGGLPSETRSFPNYSTGWSNFSYNFSLNGGMRYQISNHTSLALEFAHEKQSEYSAPNFFFEPNPTIDIFFLNNTVYPPSMNSFTLSLRHNIL